MTNTFAHFPHSTKLRAQRSSSLFPHPIHHVHPLGSATVLILPWRLFPPDPSTAPRRRSTQLWHWPQVLPKAWAAPDQAGFWLVEMPQFCPLGTKDYFPQLGGIDRHAAVNPSSHHVLFTNSGSGLSIKLSRAYLILASTSGENHCRAIPFCSKIDVSFEFTITFSSTHIHRLLVSYLHADFVWRKNSFSYLLHE